jgi:hypothetical protein
MTARSIFVLALAASLLAGCSSIKKLTGQNDNTVLPGERENVLPPDQQVNPKPGKADDLAAEQPQCDPSIDTDCPQGVDQEAAGAADQ